MNRSARSASGTIPTVRRMQDQPGATHAEKIREQLEREVASGHLLPGTRLDESEIAERFGVSRTPVREAFRLLAANEMVELKGRMGATVRKPSAQTVIEMFQVMAELEGLCARLAARRITPELRSRIEQIHTALTDASRESDVDVFYDINQAFHEAIYEAAGSHYLAEQTRRLRNRTAAYRRRVTFQPNRFASTIDEHRRVMEAIFSHNEEEAHSTMRDHVNLLSDDMRDFIASFQ
ncbi:FCD domain-containing protein [Acetobacter musti]|uniref:FCD domain-containing protein n=1 Tax=Acetobacter musti TaxID=864732 RepID=A0ABX0JNX3_9PROT|nr:GntR family transcriptional regulator [Acetobacter musti]NHN84947.1 FCD domain-containing protein [Acetobacter musti]